MGDWSFFAQVNKVFNGKRLTYQRYFTVETAYANAVVAFVADAGLDALRIRCLNKQFFAGLDDPRCKDIAFNPARLRLGSVVAKSDLVDVVRLNLRELIWCQLAAGGVSGEKFYLHFDWDLYVYIGSNSPSVEAIHYAESNGLFVEPRPFDYMSYPKI